MTTFPLGHVGPRPRVAGDPRRRLLALAGADAIVLVGTRLPGGWACHVIARRRPDKRPRRVILTDNEIDDAVTEVDADRHHDPDGYAMVWLAHVHTTLPADNIPPVARVIAEHLRRPGSLTVDLDHRAMSRLAAAGRRRVDRLDPVLQRLVDHELLAAETPPGDGCTRYQLTIPTPDRGKPGPRRSSPPLGNQPTALTRSLKEHRMPPPDPHPHWCTAVDCARSGIHESAPVVAGDQHEILGVAVARVRIGESSDAVMVAFTEDGATTAYTLPAGQARAFTRTIDRLLTA